MNIVPLQLSIIDVFSLFIGEEGHEDWLRLMSYPDADVILMCFSIDNPITLKNIEQKWIRQVKLYCPIGSSIIVVTILLSFSTYDDNNVHKVLLFCVCM